MLFLLHNRTPSITSLFIYNVMNLVINCNYFYCICNLVICVQLLVLNVKINYVDTNPSLMVLHNLIYKYKDALINKSFKPICPYSWIFYGSFLSWRPPLKSFGYFVYTSTFWATPLLRSCGSSICTSFFWAVPLSPTSISSSWPNAPVLVRWP